MSELNVSFRPQLRRPVLVAAFRGWNDGGQGASLAAGYLAKQWAGERFAEIDPEDFYDFQATRPHVSLAPSPRAALSLVRRFGELMSIDVDVSELEQAAKEYSEQVSEAVSADADTSAYVEELERRVDMLSAEEDLPSGDTLAAELTRFLREREEQDERDEGAEGPAS